MYYEVCPVGAIGGKQDLLTYFSDMSLQIGQLVEVPFGTRTKKAVIWKKVGKPKFQSKSIGIAHDEILPPELIEMANWISHYYAVRLSLVLQAIIPSGIGKSRRGEFQAADFLVKNTAHPLTNDQKRAITEIKTSPNTTHLLHGITGSGKSRIYQELARDTLRNKRSVLILVPEISLTPQLASNFQSLTKNIVVLHSRLTEASRHLAWIKVRESDEPWIVIGPRSALFTPVKNIGLIVVDECHEPSYTQDSQPKYSALRVARKLADIHQGAKLVLGSATPSITDYYIAEQTSTPIIELNQPVQSNDRKVHIVDIKEKDHFTSHNLFSDQLLKSIRANLDSNQQTLLFHNRRATARLALCTSCGWSAECKNCHVPMRLHHDSHKLKCHICGLTVPLPSNCPDCKQPDLEFRGFGSKRVEQEIIKLFPKSNVARFDSDTPEKMQIQYRYEELVSGDIDIIIGTQGLAKGLDLPRLSLIGIVSSDTELLVPDFSSAERSFQLIFQVIGRAGRGGQKSNVFIQTLNPDHYVLNSAKDQNYHEFYESELENRKAGHLPPFTYLLQLQIGYKSEATALKHCDDLKQTLKKTYPKITVRGPTPAFQSYRSGNHFAQLVVSSQSRQILVEIARSLPQKWQFTLDPINLL